MTPTPGRAPLGHALIISIASGAPQFKPETFPFRKNFTWRRQATQKGDHPGWKALGARRAVWRGIPAFLEAG